jgi:hypothetical protein
MADTRARIEQHKIHSKPSHSSIGGQLFDRERVMANCMAFLAMSTPNPSLTSHRSPMSPLVGQLDHQNTVFYDRRAP